MRKIFQILATVILVATLAFIGSNHVAKAAAPGTSPCDPTLIGSGSTCSGSIDIPDLPGSSIATTTEIPNEDVAGQTGNPPNGLNIVGPGLNIVIIDVNGKLVVWDVIPIKLCFPVFDGQVRRWVTPAELSGWLGFPVSYGVWEPIPTIYENGMTCGITRETNGTFAVFQTIQ